MNPYPGILYSRVPSPSCGPTAFELMSVTSCDNSLHLSNLLHGIKMCPILLLGFSMGLVFLLWFWQCQWAPCCLTLPRSICSHPLSFPAFLCLPCRWLFSIRPHCYIFCCFNHALCCRYGSLLLFQLCLTLWQLSGGEKTVRCLLSAG